MLVIIVPNMPDFMLFQTITHDPSYAPTTPLSLTCSRPLMNICYPIMRFSRERQEMWHDMKVKIPWQARLQSDLIILELRSV